MSVVVTGGLGFLGRYIVRELRRRGRDVVNYNRDASLASGDEHDVRVLGELHDIPRLLHVIAEQGAEAIIHTAAQSHPDVSLEMPLATVEANVTGTACVLEAARLSGIRRVVLFSSECVYGDCMPAGGSIDEATMVRPRTPYGATKAATEMLGCAYNESFAMSTVALRVSQVYGPGQVMPEPVRDALLAALGGRAFELPAGADQPMQLVHARDVAHAAVLALDAVHPQLCSYNITGGVQRTYGEILETLAQLVPGARFDVGPGRLGWDVQAPFDCRAAERDLGYVPRVGLGDGLREYADWLRDHPF